MAAAADPGLPVEVRAADVARLVADALAAPEPAPGKAPPAISRIAELLASPERAAWGTGLEACLQTVTNSPPPRASVLAQHLASAVATLISNIRKMKSPMAISMRRYIGRCLQVLASLLSASPSSSCFRASCLALRDAFALTDLVTDNELEQLIIDLTTAVTSLITQALESRNQDILRVAGDVVELGVLTKKTKLIAVIWRSVTEPFTAQPTLGKDQPRLLLAVVEGLLTQLEAAIRDGTQERITMAQAEKLSAFYAKQLTQVAVSALSPEPYLRCILRVRCSPSAPNEQLFIGVATCIIRCWSSYSASVISALPLVFLSHDWSAEAFAALSAFRVTVEILAEFGLAPLLFDRALEVALELIPRATRSLYISGGALVDLEAVLTRVMLAAYVEAPIDVQRLLLRALLHPQPSAAHTAALLFRALYSMASPQVQQALLKLLLDLCQHCASARLCHLAVELSGDAVYSRLVSAPLNVSPVSDTTWMLAASTVEACATLPLSPSCSRHLVSVVIPQCTRRLTDALSSADLSNTGYLTLLLAACKASRDAVPPQTRARLLQLTLDLLDRPQLRASPHFHQAARRAILLLPAFDQDFSNAQGVTLLASFASLLAVPALAPVVRTPIARALESLHFPRPNFDKAQLVRLQGLYRSLFAALAGHAEAWAAALSFVGGYAAWAAHTPFDDVEAYLPASFVPLLECYLQPAVLPAALSAVVERGVAVRREQSNAQGDDAHEPWLASVSAIRKAIAALQDLPPQVRARAPISSLVSQLSALT